MKDQEIEKDAGYSINGVVVGWVGVRVSLVSGCGKWYEVKSSCKMQARYQKSIRFYMKQGRIVVETMISSKYR